MAKITDPDDLIVASSAENLGIDGNLWLDTTAKTFSLAAYGNLNLKDGVTGNAIWAKFVDLWTTPEYQPFPFPMNVLDAKSGQYIFGQDPGGAYNGWKPADDTCRQTIRDAGWSEYSADGTLNRRYVGIVSLGEVNSGAQLYYQRTLGGPAYNFTFTDEVNEAIQIYGDTSNGNFDEHTYFKGYVREYAKKYKDSILADTGQTETGAYIVNLLLSNEIDLDIVDTDTNVASNAPYTSINIKYFNQAFSKEVDSTTNRDFGIVIDVGTHSGVDGTAPGGGSVLTTSEGGMTNNAFAGGTLKIHEGPDKGTIFPIVSNDATTITVTGTISAGSNLSFTAYPSTPLGASLQEIYTKVQYQLRQPGNINAISNPVIGKTASLLLNFVGSRLDCGFYAPVNPNGGGSGVIIEGIKDADLNSVKFYDNTGVAREYPFVSAGMINFSSNLVGGYFRMYFTTLPGVGNDYGESGAVTVNDKDGIPIQGTISSTARSFTFDYSLNSQGGRTPATDAPVTVVAGNPGSAKPVVAAGTITQSKAVSITLIAETDRAYIV